MHITPVDHLVLKVTDKRLLIHRETGKAIGDSGLYHLSDGGAHRTRLPSHQTVLGSRLRGRGGARAARWFDTHLAGEALFADVHPDHVKSQRVLPKLRFHPSHSELVHDVTMLIYRRRP